MVFGRYPYKRNGRKTKEVFEDILTKEVDFKDSPIVISESLKSLLNACLDKAQLFRISIVTSTSFKKWIDDT